MSRLYRMGLPKYRPGVVRISSIVAHYMGTRARDVFFDAPPCRTLEDMSEEEVRALEEKYHCPVRRIRDERKRKRAATRARVRRSCRRKLGTDFRIRLAKKTNATAYD